MSLSSLSGDDNPANVLHKIMSHSVYASGSGRQAQAGEQSSFLGSWLETGGVFSVGVEVSFALLPRPLIPAGQQKLGGLFP